MKRLLSLIITFLLIFPAFAQINREEVPVVPNNRIGVRGGLNYSKIDADLGGNTEALQGIHGGIFYQKFFSPKFSVQPEIQYSGEGWDKDGVEHRVNNLALAIIGKFYLFQGLNLNGGVQPALQFNSELDNTSSNISITDRLSRFNISAIFGVGYDLPFGLMIGSRYLQGLIDINDGLNPNTKDNEIKTRTIQIYIGYAFRLPKTDRRGLGSR